MTRLSSQSLPVLGQSDLRKGLRLLAALHCDYDRGRGLPRQEVARGLLQKMRLVSIEKLAKSTPLQHERWSWLAG